MRIVAIVAMLSVLALASGCTDSQHYPISGEDCAPTDPVRDLSVQQCAPPA